MLPLFRLKHYQANALARLGEYLRDAATHGAAPAFLTMTKRSYQPAPGLAGLPYVCLRIPTGGGKTVMAAHAIGVAADALLHTDRPTVLWLVPSRQILDQTLGSLRDLSHPNRRALAEKFGGNVAIMDVSEALYARRADYDGGAVVIVATMQAFRVDVTDGRKVYEANGELMDHFSGLDERRRKLLEPGPSGDPIPSLANALRLRRPFVIVDEAHNARTDLSFDVLARLGPSLILEFTATPVTPDEHDLSKGRYASNVLHQVSAAELKAEEMIKLPVVLRGRSDPRDTIGDAIGWLDRLAATARAEEAAGGDFIRPVMLVQAEAKSQDRPTLHADEVRRILVEDFRIAEAQVVVATGDSRGLDGVDLFARDCPVRFIVTQQALREGWDCSFAYVLCSVAEQKSARAVEQILGRVLRMPGAKRKRHEDLNRAYAFATTTSFQHAAATLRDGLVSHGFARVEAAALVRVEEEVFDGLGVGGSAFVVEEAIPEAVDVAAFKATVEAATGGRVEIDIERRVIRARGALSEFDQQAMILAAPSAAAAIRTISNRSRGANVRRDEPEAASMPFTVPCLAVRTAEGVRLFDRSHFLDIPWKLEESDAAAILDFLALPSETGDEARLDVASGGELHVQFVEDLHEQLALALGERGWTQAALVNWLDRRLPFSSRRDITRASSTLFIARALDAIMAERGIDLAAVARSKFRVVDALTKVIARHRDTREKKAFQRALFTQSGLDFEATAAVEHTFTEHGYSYQEPYNGGHAFNKHHFSVVGDLNVKGDEFECAVYIDRHPRVLTWVRNPVRQPGSFWLQTSSDKFYPDFVVRLTDGRTLVIEYKGEDRITADDAEEKKLVGDLWADRSGGRGLFLMFGSREMARIDRAIGV